MTYLHYVLSELILTNIFDTNGIRSLINKESTVDIVMNLGRVIESVLGSDNVAMARDSRMGGEMFTRLKTAGLRSTYMLKVGC